MNVGELVEILNRLPPETPLPDNAYSKLFPKAQKFKCPDPGRPVVIYALYDPETREPWYIGSTQNPANRFKNHTREASYSLSDWFNFLCQRGVRPEYHVVEWVSKHQRDIREDYWIREALKANPYLINEHGLGGLLRDRPMTSVEKKKAWAERYAQITGRTPPPQDMEALWWDTYRMENYQRRQVKRY